MAKDKLFGDQVPDSGEPVFVLRGANDMALNVIRQYRASCSNRAMAAAYLQELDRAVEAFGAHELRKKPDELFAADAGATVPESAPAPQADKAKAPGA